MTRSEVRARLNTNTGGIFTLRTGENKMYVLSMTVCLVDQSFFASQEELVHLAFRKGHAYGSYVAAASHRFGLFVTKLQDLLHK